MLTDRQKGRMIYKISRLRSGSHWYRKSSPQPYFTRQEIFEAMGVTPKQAERLVGLYLVDAPQSGWSLSADEQALIVDLAKKGTFTPAQILRIKNQTTRKNAMEAYGLERLIKNGGGVKGQQDDFGTLWILPMEEGQDRTALYVEVINTTPEPDGHYAHYFLRVPPNTTTAREAVAWIGGLTAKETLTFTGFAAQS